MLSIINQKLFILIYIMKTHPFSLIDEDEENTSQTHYSPKNKQSNKEEEDDKNINNIETAKKEKEMKNLGINNQQIINNFKDKMNKEKLFHINLKNKILSQFNNTNNILTKEKQNIGQQDIGIIIKKEEKKDEKLSKTLLNEKKEKKKSYHGKIYFFIAITMLIYQYLSYIILIEIPIIISK